MQAIAPLAATNFLARVQKLTYRLEVWSGAAWIDIDNLGGESGSASSGSSRKPYLKSISVQLGGPGATPTPVEGEWSAEIDNEDGIFHPFHPTSPYADLLRLGREVRISYGGEYGGTAYSWQRLIGFMDAPRFNASSHSVSISGRDYSKLLTDTFLRDAENIVESGSGSGSTEVGDIIQDRKSVV